MVDLVHQTVMEDRRLAVNDIAEACGILSERLSHCDHYFVYGTLPKLSADIFCQQWRRLSNLFPYRYGLKCFTAQIMAKSLRSTVL